MERLETPDDHTQDVARAQNDLARSARQVVDSARSTDKALRSTACLRPATGRSGRSDREQLVKRPIEVPKMKMLKSESDHKDWCTSFQMGIGETWSGMMEVLRESKLSKERLSPEQFEGMVDVLSNSPPDCRHEQWSHRAIS